MADNVDRLVDGICELADRHYADLRFAEPLGRIEVTRRIPRATAVRIELPQVEHLHLASVIIDADGLDDPAGQTRRSMSSTWKDYDQTLASGLIFDPGHTGKAFHTRKDDHPWLEIGFDRPRDLHKISVRNVDGPTSQRARGLQVIVRTADGRLRTVYDGVARERQFVAAAERYANSVPLPSRPQVGSRMITNAMIDLGRAAVHRVANRTRPSVAPAPDLGRMLVSILLRDYQAVRFAARRTDVDPAALAAFRSAVNRRILRARELEWTSHGVRRSFRFWTPQQQRSYLDFTLEVIAALRELTADVCLGFGSVLSVVRDHALLPHDDDLDVLIGFEPSQAATHAAGRDQVRQCLTEHGFKVSGAMRSYQWVTRPGGGPRLDVFIGVFEDDRISWYPGRRAALTRAMMFPPSTQDFLGRSVPVPAEPEQYLAQIYGPGWVSPDPDFQHTWEPERYADIAGD